MVSSQIQWAAFIVTLGAVAFAIAVGVWALSFTRSARTHSSGWRSRAAQLELAVDRADALLAAHPGVLLAWDDEARGGEAGWGAPSLYGAPAAIASLLRFADAQDENAPIEARILDGLADFDAVDAAGDATTLRKALERLGQDGAPFSLVIQGPGGRKIEVDGRAAGLRIALWVADPNLKAAEYLTGAGRDEEAGRRIFDDPAAFEDVLRRLPLPAWRMSSSAKLVWANDAYAHIVEAKSPRDAVERDMPFDESIRDQALQTISDGPLSDQRLITAVGSQRMVEIITFPISGGVAGVAVDITPIAQDRDEARLVADRRSSALNRASDAVAIFSPDRALVFHNTAFAKMFGLDPEWLAANPTHGDVLDKLHEMGKTPRVANYGAWRTAELALHLKHDEPLADTLWELADGVRLRMSRVRHPSGGGAVIVRDETETQRLRTDLNTQISVQSATLDKLSDALAVFGSSGKCELQNAAFGEMWDLPAELRKEGAAFADMIDAGLPLFTDRSAWLRMKARITNLDPDVRREFSEEIERVDGKVLRYTSKPLPNGATAISFSDVTADRNLQKALEDRNAAMQAAERVQQDFVGHVSYQLRAPLQTIVGFAELLKMQLANDNPDQGNQADAIIQASTELGQIVENILDIAAITSNTMEMDWSEVELRATLEGALSIVQTSAEDSRLRFKFECPADIGRIRADAKRLKQIVYQLLVNAKRHAPAGGQVTLGAARNESGVQVWVEDDGPGIPADQQARMFEPFVSGKKGGAGLGLTLVREFVRLHGGWVDVHSEVGTGTKVTCHFPARPTDEGGAGETDKAA